MNGRCTLVILLIFCFTYITAQDSLNTMAWMDMTSDAYISEMGQFSIAANPAGLLFFGPFIHAELGLGKHLRINTQVRFPRLGLMSQVQHSPYEIISGYGLGGGLMYFIGKQKNKPYVGFLMEYSQTTASYSDPYARAYTDKFYSLALHAGYRVRYKSGFYVQYGLYLFAVSETDEINFKNPSFSIGNSNIPIPIPCPDIRIGFEF